MLAKRGCRIIVSFSSPSRKSRSSYPYRLERPVSDPRPCYNSRMGQALAWLQPRLAPQPEFCLSAELRPKCFPSTEASLSEVSSISCRHQPSIFPTFLVILACRYSCPQTAHPFALGRSTACDKRTGRPKGLASETTPQLLDSEVFLRELGALHLLRFSQLGRALAAAPPLRRQGAR